MDSTSQYKHKDVMNYALDSQSNPKLGKANEKDKRHQKPKRRSS